MGLLVTARLVRVVVAIALYLLRLVGCFGQSGGEVRARRLCRGCAIWWLFGRGEGGGMLAVGLSACIGVLSGRGGPW